MGLRFGDALGELDFEDRCAAIARLGVGRVR